MVARALDKVGGGGRTFRYGGEEFAIIFRGKTIRDVESRLETLRAAVADSAFTVRGADRPQKRPEKPAPRITKSTMLSVTVSIGVAQVGEHSPTVPDVLEAADEALYRAKEQGRDRVVTERRKKWRR